MTNDEPNIFEIHFNFESTLINVSTTQVLIVFRGSVFRVQEKPRSPSWLLPRPEL
jgi:hypothetical protein